LHYTAPQRTGGRARRKQRRHAVPSQRLRRHQHRAGELGDGRASRSRGLYHEGAGSLEKLGQAFTDFQRLFNGQYPGYLGCDTVYHDVQHSLDDTLATARLLVGYDRTHAPEQQLGAERALLGLVVALFHDSGYIRQTEERAQRNGAEFTLTHVARSAQFLARYLPAIDMAEWVPVATQIVHFTITSCARPDPPDDPRDRRVGHLFGTADDRRWRIMLPRRCATDVGAGPAASPSRATVTASR
jgi:hypothetical protein